MRNLKRALSLTLASVMLLGMMVVGAGAASYPDVDDADNIEAIEVLQAVKVMQGDENGNFRPGDSVSRAEMAVVMANLLDLDYDYYASTCPFTDVPNWARGYVGACYANGIVSGYSATTYGANDSVTAVQAASMMMRALGYFQYASDYADGFELSTVRQGTRIGMFNGVGSSADKAMTRNQVAQMALNALEATMVDAKKTSADITVGSGDTAVSISGQVEYIVRTSSENFAKTINKTEVNGNSVNGVQGPTVELGEQLYNGDLKKLSDTDAFGAPATRWTYKAKDIGKYADAPDLTYLDAVKIKDIYKDLELSKSPAITIYKEDGEDLTTDNDGESLAIESRTSPEGGKPLTDKTTTGQIGNSKIGHKGSVTKVYYTESTATGSEAANDKATVVIMNYYLVQATDDYNSSDKKLDVEIKSEDVTLDPSTLELEDFLGITSVKEGEYLVVTVADGVVKSVAPVEVVTDVQVTAARNGDYVTAGQKYTYNAVAAKEDSGALGNELMTDASQYSMGDKGYNLYLDPNGYVLGIEAVDGEANVGDYVFIKEVKPLGFDVIAKALFTDGTTETITVTKVDNGTSAVDATATNVAADTFYTFKTTKSGNYELTLVPSDGEKAKQNKAADACLDNKAQPIRAENGTVKVNSSANSNTVFIAKDKATVGVKNAPETPKAEYVYYVVDKNNRLLIVYSPEKGSNSASADDIVYILDKKPTVTKEDGDTYYTYFAVVDGEKTESFASNDAGKAAGLYVVKSYTDGRADLGTAVVGTVDLATNAGAANKDKAECKNGTLTLDTGKSYLVADNVKIRTIDGTTVKSISATGVKNAVKDGFDQVYVIKASSDNEEISTIYLVKGAEVKSIPASDATQANIAEALEDEKVTDVNVENANLTDGNASEDTEVPAGKTLTLTGTAQGTASTEEGSGSKADGKIVRDNVTVASGAELDLSDAKVTGTVTVPEDSTLKLGDDAEVTVKLEGEDSAVEATIKSKITIEGVQKAPVKVDITGTTASTDNNLLSEDFKTAIAEVMPSGGQVDLGTQADTVNDHNSSWRMLDLVLPEGERKHESLIVSIYTENGETLLARQNDKKVGGIGFLMMTTKNMDSGCWTYVNSGATSSITGDAKARALAAGTYKYEVVVGELSDYASTGGNLPTGAKEILTGYFTVE